MCPLLSDPIRKPPSEQELDAPEDTHFDAVVASMLPVRDAITAARQAAIARTSIVVDHWAEFAEAGTPKADVTVRHVLLPADPTARSPG